MHSIILKVMAFIASGVCTTQARRSLARSTGAHRPRGTGQTSWTRPPAEFSTRRWVKIPVSKIVSREQSLVSRERPNLFAAAGAVMVLVPEAVHRRAQEADPHHEGHHASHNRCQARLWPVQRNNQFSAPFQLWSHINDWFITHYLWPTGPKEQCRKSKC